MLELRQVTSGYGRSTVLRDVSFSVEQGSITSLIGANGAGKTTALRTIVNQVKARSGDVLFRGKPIQSLRTDQIVDCGLSMVPEGRRIFDGLTVLENLKVGAYVCRGRDECARRLEFILDLFPKLAELKEQMGTSLSGGEQQMLAIGRSLMSGPQMLLLDEPSMGLAPRIVDQVFAVIAKLRANGTSILLIEQNAHRALQLADYAYVLENGRIAMQGRGAELLADQNVVSAYLGETGFA